MKEERKINLFILGTNSLKKFILFGVFFIIFKTAVVFPQENKREAQKLNDKAVQILPEKKSEGISLIPSFNEIFAFFSIRGSF